MQAAPRSTREVRASRWTPFRLLVVGAGLGLFALLLDASTSAASTLAFLSGGPDPVPVWLYLANVAVAGILGPVGLFLVLSGIAFTVLSLRPRGRSRALRVTLFGAGLNLAAGLLLGVLNLSLYLLPLDAGSLGFLREAVIIIFFGTVASGVGVVLAFWGIAWAGRTDPRDAPVRSVLVRRPRRGKSIYEARPSGR